MNNKELISYCIYSYRDKKAIAGSQEGDWKLAEMFLSKKQPDLMSIGEEESLLNRWLDRYYKGE